MVRMLKLDSFASISNRPDQNYPEKPAVKTLGKITWLKPISKTKIRKNLPAIGSDEWIESMARIKNFTHPFIKIYKQIW